MTKNLPYELQMGRFLSSRNEEVQLLCNEVSKSVSTGMLASQQVTRRMRRRAVSHNPKRLPRRLRDAHLGQRTKSGTDGVGSVRRPSRRWRRRPGNLLSEYNRRQRNITWLETHIWHAKRFHMTRVWGHALPLTPTDKCWRLTYRGLTRGCVLWDVSYHKLVQLCGDKHVILDKLNLVTDSRTGHVFQHAPGETRAIVYSPGQYPRGVVGDVRYVWRPSEDGGVEDMLWIWCHPGVYSQWLDILTDIFSLEDTGGKSVESLCDCSNEFADKVGQEKLKPKSEPPKTLTGSGIHVTLLENTLNRFRLRGPNSLPMISHCLENVTNIREGSALRKYCDGKQKSLLDLNQSFQPINENVISGAVLGLVVKDPRLTLPTKRGMLPYSHGAKKKEGGQTSADWSLQASGLWCDQVRRCVSLCKVSDHDVNTCRQSGTSLSVPNTSAVPIMVICEDDGCDLIIPQGWAMPIWMSLVCSGAKVGGQKEMEHCQLESGRNDLAAFEDSPWARLEAEKQTKTMSEKYFALPPDKRPNFNILGTLSPFSRPWTSLTGLNDWFVLRDKEVLDRLSQGHVPCSYEHSLQALVLVHFSIEGKGKLSENTGIYLPLNCDLEGADVVLEEVHHKDDLDTERKGDRVLHQDKLKQLKRKWKKIKQKKTQLLLRSACDDKDVDQNKMEEVDISLRALKGLRNEEISSYKVTNQNSWIPQDVSKIKDFNCRTLVGWIVHGGYSLNSGGEVGIGLVTLSSINILLERSMTKVLTRQPDNSVYRIASWKIAK